MYPLGRTFQALLFTCHINRAYTTNYIKSITDKTMGNECRPKHDHVGVNITMYNSSFPPVAAQNPSFGCHGTLSIVNSAEYGVSFELNTIVANHRATRLVFIVIRHLSTRKTQAARRVFIQHFVKVLDNTVISNPLSPSSAAPFSMGRDFARTYEIALGDALSEKYRSGCSMDYVRKVRFACRTHAKRIVLNNLDTDKEHGLFAYVTSTRNIT